LFFPVGAYLIVYRAISPTGDRRCNTRCARYSLLLATQA
jgi:hypothetical protein